MDTAALERRPLLRTDLWRYSVEEHEAINERLLAEIRQHQKDQPEPLRSSNEGCWRGVRHYDAEKLLLPMITEATLDILDRYRAEEGDARGPLDREQIVTDVFYWTNVNSRGSANVEHDHKDAGDMAGVYYIQGTGTGDILFRTAQTQDQELTAHLPFTASYAYSPQDGDLLLFPSYLRHEVLPNPSDRERINIAFNVSVIPKGAGPMALIRRAAAERG